MSNPFFSTNMPLKGKRDAGKPEEVRVVRREDVRAKSLHSRFQPDPNARPEATRVIMSSDLRKMEENRRHMAVSAQRKAAVEKATAAKGEAPAEKKPVRRYTRRAKAAEKPQREVRTSR